jgi:hypothetical protein
VALAPFEGGIRVTMGQQQWLTPKLATFSVAMGLVGMLVTPFALFALLWPVSEAIASTNLPGDIWSTIDTYLASQGATLTGTEQLQHPHEAPQTYTVE